uniref:LysR family transcriptional regulator n=1 Tax=Strongyloides venezuelensis TaxID=75913 RepID=A0A0K0ETW2_STRVS
LISSYKCKIWRNYSIRKSNLLFTIVNDISNFYNI